MPINIHEFENLKAVEFPTRLAKKIFEFLKSNKDKAYSALDFQNEFKVNYTNVSSAIRVLKSKYGKEINYRWIRLGGQTRCVYYAYKSPHTSEEK